ncbi:Polyisoprenoid-binding protein YceI [Aquiflexum balticum DSM 16537]|uniref:Polyisoprenoid-binding protein YceI n=1 Tax=Aquiflexum balticum DSM 16537 TaxID=758820 RepID=A0A1W2H3M9_9BACT|nr:YceI family protein [Aquiflexum balticum]SMD43076.1 Polyisoprenoid-binding protein YceI [Aquiflexum balticum DSM 16537]
MSTTTATTTKWAIDPTHSEVSFKVKHLVISTVTGYFKSFEGTVDTESEDFDGANISFSADIASIFTNQSDRDNHLKSADFFDAEKFPKMSFSGILKGSALEGELTIKDITKKVTLDVDFGGIVEDPYGQTKAGFEIEGKISRKEFGLMWNAVTEAGSVVVSDQVRIIVNAQVVKQ